MTIKLIRRGTPPDSPEMFRKGGMECTNHELGDFKPQNFVDRTAQIERATGDPFDAGNTLVPGHKIMAGMP
jgi:hypothetical protein